MVNCQVKWSTSIIVGCVAGMLNYFNATKENFIITYSILFILVIIFNRKMMNEVLIEK